MVVGRRVERGGAALQRTCVRCIRVVHIQVNRLRRGRVRLASIAHLDRAVADRHFRVHDFSVGRRHAHPLRSFERRFQEFDELCCTSNDDVRCNGRQSRPQVMNGSRLRFPHSCFCCCCAFAHRRSPLQIGFQCCSKLFARQVTQFLSHALQRSQLAVRFFFRAWLQRSEEHTSELQSRFDLVCRLLLEKKKQKKDNTINNIK